MKSQAIITVNVHDITGLTYGIEVVFHLFPVFHVHGPHMAVEQARGIGDCVCSCTVGRKKKYVNKFTFLAVAVHDIRKKPF